MNMHMYLTSHLTLFLFSLTSANSLSFSSYSSSLTHAYCIPISSYTFPLPMLLSYPKPFLSYSSYCSYSSSSSSSFLVLHPFSPTPPIPKFFYLLLLSSSSLFLFLSCARKLFP